MIKHAILVLAAIVSLSAAAEASECTLSVAGETIEFAHVVARTEPNYFDESKDDVIIHCFREEIPSERLSPSEIIWFRPDSGRIDIELAPTGHVTMVNLHSEAVQGMISGMNFGVVFEGQREGEQLSGSIETTKDLTTLVNGEKSDPWRVSASLDLLTMAE